MSALSPAERCVLSVSGAQEMLLTLQGRWSLDTALPEQEPFVEALAAVPNLAKLTVAGAALGEWDGTLIAFLLPMLNGVRKKGVRLDFDHVPAGLMRLIALADAVPDRTGASTKVSTAPDLRQRTQQALAQTTEVVAFIGEVSQAAYAVVRRRAAFPLGDFLYQVELCGVEALPIVGLISFLVGMIISFVGALALRQFGTGIYVVNLVGLSTARELAPVMTAIVLAGRTGAAFAAELGAMQSNEEVDALNVLGISPYAYLVMPRLLALTIMMPLLCLYADLLGIAGGMMVAHGMLGISAPLFLHQLSNSLPMYQITVGFAKSWVFGIIVAVAGCYHGLKSGRSAADVGAATTRAVVTSILFVVVADGVFAIVLQIIGV